MIGSNDQWSVTDSIAISSSKSIGASSSGSSCNHASVSSSGIYKLGLDGAQIYCNMDIDGGRWSLYMLNGGDAQHKDQLKLGQNINGYSSNSKMCPESHKYEYGSGTYCCKYNEEKVTPSEGASCEGSKFHEGGVTSICCKNDEAVRCVSPPCVKFSSNDCSPRPPTVCEVTDGSTSNPAGVDCRCGSNDCTDVTGRYCLASSNTCSTRPPATCSVTNGKTASSDSFDCQCGSADCPKASAVMYCLASSNTCSTRPPLR